MASPFLSKTQFIRGLQCLKSLYLFKHHPELISKISDTRETLFQSGKDVGFIARELFPNGVEIKYNGASLFNQVEKTRSAIKKGVKTLYEAAFHHDGLFVKADILTQNSGGWNLYEVKNSTSIKDFHVEDVAFQNHVMQKAGLPISKSYIVHINNQYERNGELEIENLFVVADITNEVYNLQNDIIQQIKLQREVLKGSEPIIDIGIYCNAPYECEFKEHCWRHIPEESVFSIKGRGIKAFDLYRQGIVGLQDIDREQLPLSGQNQLDCAIYKRNLVSKDALKEFLNTIWYPLYFLDFETFTEPIPLYDKTRPYQHVPFQYSLHYLTAEAAELGHSEFLAAPKTDPRKPLIEKLVSEVPEDACIIAYNATFEKSVLNSCKLWLPELQNKIDKIINNMRDVMIPFKNQDYYSWEMRGSYSIKAVLPVLVPELSYDTLKINDGEKAMSAFREMNNSDDAIKIENIRKGLLEYCEMDTYGMVKLMEKLKNITDN